MPTSDNKTKKCLVLNLRADITGGGNISARKLDTISEAVGLAVREVLQDAGLDAATVEGTMDAFYGPWGEREVYAARPRPRRLPRRRATA